MFSRRQVKYPLLQLGCNAYNIKKERQYYKDTLGIIQLEEEKNTQKRKKDKLAEEVKELNKSRRERLKIKIAELSNDDKKLFKILKKLRLNLAQSEGISAFCVFYDSMLYNFCLMKPTTKEEFLSIPQIQEYKYRKYGEEVLKEIKKFKTRNT